VRAGFLEEKERDGVAMRFLGDLNPGDRAKVVRLGGRGSIRRRLLDMGLVTGSEVEIERVAPLGDPVEVRIKGYHLSLRKEDAASIQVEVL
jgi:Fe2+ transport system protein FeoA